MSPLHVFASSISEGKVTLIIPKYPVNCNKSVDYPLSKNPLQNFPIWMNLKIAVFFISNIFFCNLII